MLDRRTLLLALAGAGLSPRTGRAQADSPLIFAEARVMSRTGRLLVDTGAPGTVLDRRFARSAGAALGERRTLRGEGGRGSILGHEAHNVGVQVRGGPRIVLEPVVADLSDLALMTGQAVDGILGGDYFGRMALELDYRTGDCRFPDADRPPRPGGWPIHILHTPYVRGAARHQGRRVQGSFQIDTGSNTAIQFYAPVARRRFPGVQGQPVETLGIAGRGQSLMAPLDRFEAAGLVLQGIMADFADELRPDDAPPDYVGLIGGPAFAGRVLTIDYRRARLWLDD